jgi:hypothetical protein
MVPYAAEADDIFQETAATIWEKFSEYEQGTDFKNWALTIARFNGQVDNLQILNYPLTSEQIAQEYLGIVGGWICDSQLPALQYDYDKNCLVDIDDLAILDAEWLKSNRIYAQ